MRVLRFLSTSRSGPRAVRLLALALAASLALTGCQSDLPVQKDLRSDSFQLVDHDSAAVTFPEDYRGDVLLVSYIYTQCPDVCPLITANMRQVRDALQDTNGVRFVSITFDPRRDTPSRLASYRSAFGIADATPWPFLTGTPTTIDTLMSRLDVKTSISSGDTTGTYFIDHTDQITLIDGKGRVRYQYHGSRTPPEMIAEDVAKLRG